MARSTKTTPKEGMGASARLQPTLHHTVPIRLLLMPQRATMGAATMRPNTFMAA